MPALLTHYTFACKALPKDLEPYRSLVNLGTQGPDTFMAYGSLPWRKREKPLRVRNFGHAMHAIDVGPTYLKMMDYADSSENKDMLYAYIEGILMHYCVDRIMHAYIFYRSGVDENGQLTGYYSWSHGFFEAILDKVFARRRGTYKKLYRCILTEDSWAREVSKMWAASSPTPLEEDDFYLSYLDFVGAEKMLWNPHGIRHILFRLIGKYSVPNAQSHPFFMKKFKKMDVTNDKGNKWLNPSTGEEHHESIDEMFDMALKDYEYVHSLLERRRKGEDIASELGEFTKVLCHEGHPIGVKKHLYKLCWEEVGKKKYLPPKK
ncbi:MAG: zinc dependent phospholipase C family protein [Bacilli bacterium]|nr:zinc dependent phospholipase C family protein [Bacilli bacterium]